jgi:dihydroorotate dehydrogenase (NAD+) catalytic subunit
MGGVTKAENVLEFILAGASGVAISTMNFTDPYICPKIIKELPYVSYVLDRYKVESIQQLVDEVKVEREKKWIEI